MTKPTNETRQSQSPKPQQLSDLELDAVNGGRQTPKTDFGDRMVQGSGKVVSGGSGVGGS